MCIIEDEGEKETVGQTETFGWRSRDGQKREVVAQNPLPPLSVC